MKRIHKTQDIHISSESYETKDTGYLWGDLRKWYAQNSLVSSQPQNVHCFFTLLLQKQERPQLLLYEKASKTPVTESVH